MAKEKKKKQIMVDYGKLNRSMYQNMRAVGIMLAIFSVIALISGGIEGHLGYIPFLILGIACAAYGIDGLSKVRKAEEELEKQKKQGKK